MSYLNFHFHENAEGIQEIPHEKFLPFAASKLHTRKVNNLNILAQGPNVKTIYELILDIQNIDSDFKPGDAIGILPRNNRAEIDQIIIRFGWQDLADKPYTLLISENTTKKKPVIPKHLPQTSTIRTLFDKYVDVRSIPKKLFLKGLLNFTTDQGDRQKLEKLSDSKSYEYFINNEGRTLLKLLTYLPSCQPSVEFLFENLPPLQPRYYSVASSPKIKNKLKIVFSITTNPDGSEGVCTGFLKNAAEVEFYFRKSSEFLKFNDDCGAIILVGIGSGLAPYLGYLQDKFLEIDEKARSFKADDLIRGDKEEISKEIDSIKGNNENNKLMDNGGINNDSIEENIDILQKNIDCIDINSTKSSNNKINTGLYFGCRYPNEDFIYKNQLSLLLESNILDWLRVAFSRHENLRVQDKIMEDGLKISDYILKENATVCVCGDGNILGQSIEEKLIGLLENFGGKTSEEARQYLKKMRNEKRFQLDIW